MKLNSLGTLVCDPEGITCWDDGQAASVWEAPPPAYTAPPPPPPAPPPPVVYGLRATTYPTTLEQALQDWDQSNFDWQSCASMIRTLATPFGFSEAQLIAAVAVFGAQHFATYQSGYTEGSNYAAIAVNAIRDALNAAGLDGNAYVAKAGTFIQQGAAQAQQRWQATQHDDNLWGSLLTIASIAAAAFTGGASLGLWSAGDLGMNIANGIKLVSAANGLANGNITSALSFVGLVSDFGISGLNAITDAQDAAIAAELAQQAQQAADLEQAISAVQTVTDVTGTIADAQQLILADLAQQASDAQAAQDAIDAATAASDAQAAANALADAQAQQAAITAELQRQAQEAADAQAALEAAQAQAAATDAQAVADAAAQQAAITQELQYQAQQAQAAQDALDAAATQAAQDAEVAANQSAVYTASTQPVTDTTSVTVTDIPDTGTPIDVQEVAIGAGAVAAAGAAAGGGGAAGEVAQAAESAQTIDTATSIGATVDDSDPFGIGWGVDGEVVDIPADPFGFDPSTLDTNLDPFGIGGGIDGEVIDTSGGITDTSGADFSPDVTLPPTVDAVSKASIIDNLKKIVGGTASAITLFTKLYTAVNHPTGTQYVRTVPAQTYGTAAARYAIPNASTGGIAPNFGPLLQQLALPAIVLLGAIALSK